MLSLRFSFFALPWLLRWLAFAFFHLGSAFGASPRLSSPIRHAPCIQSHRVGPRVRVLSRCNARTSKVKGDLLPFFSTHHSGLQAMSPSPRAGVSVFSCAMARVDGCVGVIRRHARICKGGGEERSAWYAWYGRWWCICCLVVCNVWYLRRVCRRVLVPWVDGVWVCGASLRGLVV